MISLTFALSGALLIMTAVLFGLDRLTALTQTAAWLAIFFLASPAASSAYLSLGYIVAALLLLAAAVVELKWGVDAEGKSLESIADPLSH